MQLGLQFPPDKCKAIWYRSNDPDWNFKIAGKGIPWRASVKYLGVIIDKRLNFNKQVDYIRQKTNRKMNLLKVLNPLSDVNAKIMKNIHTATIHNDGPWQYRQVTGRPESRGASYSGVPRDTSAKMLRHELHMLPVKHRAKLSIAKLNRNIRGNTKHPLHDTINRRQRN